ncbi:MAG: hypothetical protein SWH61_04565 [Thermodesulfobacteriota bacterium]|nr:hypothetical protein [Thermodesulfobacteriota bacterium]
MVFTNDSSGKAGAGRLGRFLCVESGAGFVLGGVAATLIAFVVLRTGNVGGSGATTEESWMFYAGILLLVSFMPLTAFSHRRFRLPRKNDEYRRIMERLNSAGIEDAATFTVLDEKYKTWDYLLPLAFVSLFSFMGFVVLFQNNADILLSGLSFFMNESPVDHKKGSLLAMVMAFLGAYVWSIQYILKRLVTVDLPPGAYYNVGIRMVLGAFVALIFYHFIAALPKGEFGLGNVQLNLVPNVTCLQMMPVIGFLTGIFPQRAILYIAERFKFTSDGPTHADTLPLDMLEGITQFHKVRLSELGIENIQNLVKASLVELILKTPYKPRQIIDWMVQGKLCLFFHEDIVALRKAGVRTILGFKLLGDQGLLANLSHTSGIDAARLESVYEIIKESASNDRLAKAKDCLHSV